MTYCIFFFSSFSFFQLFVSIVDDFSNAELEQAQGGLSGSDDMIESKKSIIKSLSGGDLLGLQLYPPMCLDHCGPTCNQVCSCLKCSVEITFNFGLNEKDGAYITKEQAVAVQMYIATMANVPGDRVDIAVMAGDYNPLDG